MKFVKIPLVFILLLAVPFFSSCSKQSEKRVFEEVIITSARVAPPMLNPHSPDGKMSEDSFNPHAAVGLPSPEEMMKNPGSFGAMGTPGEVSNPHAAVGLPSPEEMMKGQGMPSDLKLQWTLPVDWVERESSGMRLAAFSTGSDANYAECTIVSLGGGAGGLESNIVRWMGQVSIPQPPDAEFQKFLSKLETFKTQDGSPATFVDLTQLQSGAPDTQPSIFTTIVDFKDLKIFVKMAGSKAALVKNRDKFRAFCKSLSINQ